MASENLTPDGNTRNVAGAVTDDSNAFIKRLRIDDTTKGLKVLVVGGSVGTVSSITAGTGLTATPSNPITTTGTIALDSKLAPLDTLGSALQSIRVNAGATALEYYTPSSGSIVVGTTTITSGTSTRILYDNAGVVGEYTLTGTGTVVVMATSPTMSNPTVGTQTATDNSTLAASTAFVQTAIANAIAGVDPAVAVNYATTAAGDTSGLTYNNGVSGVGATLTGANNTAITIDGHTFVVGDVGVTRLLVKNDTQSPSGAFNGIYLFTALQTVGTGAIFTRALDYDTPSNINSTGAIPVLSGTANALTSWLLNTTVVTVGTTPITYTQFSFNPSRIIPANLGGTGIANNASSTITITGSFGTTFTVSGTTSLTLPTSGTVTAQGNTVTGSGNIVLATSPTLTSPALGTPTALVGTNISGTGTSFTSGITQALASATTSVNVSSATAPSSGQVLSATSSTAATWQSPAGGSFSPYMTTTVVYDASGSAKYATFGTGTTTYNTQGVRLATAASSGKAETIVIQAAGASYSHATGQIWNCQFSPVTHPADGSSYFGWGNVSIGGTPNYTFVHAGFKILYTAGPTATLYATQADGTTEAVSSALTTLATGDVVSVCYNVTSSTNINYYWRNNNGAWSSATALNTHSPVGTGTDNNYFQTNIYNGTSAVAMAVDLMSNSLTQN